MQIRFHISEALIQQLSWEEYEAIERAQDGDMRLHHIRPIVARFMVNEKLEPLKHEAAMRELGKIPVTKIADVIKAFMDALKEKAVPKASGDSSQSESGKVGESPAGAEL